MVKNDISLLDYFAGQALAGVISSSEEKMVEKQVALAYFYAELMVKRAIEGKEKFGDHIKNQEKEENKNKINYEAIYGY